MSTVQEIKAAIDGLSPVERAKLEHLLRQANPPLDLEVDSPALEAELLKAAQGPFTPFSPGISAKTVRRSCARDAANEFRAAEESALHG